MTGIGVRLKPKATTKQLWDAINQTHGSAAADEAVAVYTRKGKKRERPEDVVHIGLAKDLRALIGPPGFNNNGVFWETVASENKGGKRVTTSSGKEISLAGVAAKAKGVAAGSPDVHLIIYGRPARIELKAGKNGLTTAQEGYAREFQAAGGLWAVCYTREAALKQLTEWGVKFRAGWW